MTPRIELNPKGKGDWIAYELRNWMTVVRHRGDRWACIDAVLHNPEPPLYVKWKPL